MAKPIRKILGVANGVQISYLEWGQGNMPLLLLHGMADQALVWTSLAESLGPRYHIIAPDLRGHGESSKPSSGYHFTDSIGDMTALMAAHHWTSAHILGHSWAGKMIAVWAQQQPEHFRSLILVDPAFINALPSWTKITFPLFYKILPFLKMLGPFENKAAAMAQAKQLKQYQGWTPLQQAVFEASVEQKINGQWGSKFTIDAREPMFDDVMRVSGLTRPLEIPTLLIQPTMGINKSDRQLKPFRTYLRNLDIITMESNHWVFLVNPEAFNRAIAQFLAQQLADDEVPRGYG